MLLFYSYIIVVLSISLTNSALLDESCSNNISCEGVSLVCSEGKCRCRIPLYRPCNSSCALNPRSAYEGEPCEQRDHCVSNAICSGEKKCQCTNGFTAKNGLCFKNLNEACTGNSDCWSQYCLNQRCACGHGYESTDDRTGCRRKRVKIYSSWADAKANNAFCSDASSCTDVIAICFNDTQHPTAKFCKCPYGYQVTNNNERCEPIKISSLSPLSTIQSGYSECGVCEDQKAACIRAGTETTCWCRSGYVNNNNTCESKKPAIIFPNSYDLNHYDYDSNCADNSNGQHEVHNRLCVCAPEYKFVAKDKSCVKIVRDLINDVLEYGDCTRTNSKDQAFRENSLCPQPLTCQERKDKYVCSCGKDKFLDMDNSSQCVYYIGKKTNSSDDLCPKYASRNSTTGICQCPNGYKIVNENRQCELKLSSQLFSPNSDRPYDEVCTKSFGRRVSLYTNGECRCSGNQSFPDQAQTHCFAPLNQRLVLPMEDCPENSVLVGDHCRCNVGYYATSNNSCETVKLSEYRGPKPTTANRLTDADCKSFSGPVEPYDNEHCQCQNGSFVNNNGTGCWFYLDITLSNPSDSNYCPPKSYTGSGQACICDTGFTKKDEKTCEPITTRVYDDGNANAPNIVGLSDADCREWFGTGATLSTQGQYCICKPYAYAVWSNTYCHFLIDALTTDIKGVRTCPANTEIDDSSASAWACVCKQSFHKSSDNRTCESAEIPLVGALNMSASNCQTFTNENCISKYGEFAFCRDEKCYCNRQLSYLSSNKCEVLPVNIFPGMHEYHLYSCITNEDCGSKQNLVCDYLNQDSDYKVCHCEKGYLLDPKTRACVKYQCVPECNTAQNFECREYACACKEGYHQSGRTCVKNSYKLELHQYCNRTLLEMLSSDIKVNDSLQCDETCSRVKCKDVYRSEQNQCARYELNNDRCFFRENICAAIDENAVCSRDENKCLCQSSYYEFEQKCVRAVGTNCATDKECGPTMICKERRCSCNDKQREEEVLDVYGQLMRRCVNGIDRIRFSPLFFLIVIIGLFFN